MIDVREFFRVIDAVLQRQYKRPVVNQRPDLFSGGFGVVRFDAKQNQIDLANRCRIVGELGVVDLQIVIGARDPETVCPECLQVPAAGDES